MWIKAIKKKKDQSCTEKKRKSILKSKDKEKNKQEEKRNKRAKRNKRSKRSKIKDNIFICYCFSSKKICVEFLIKKIFSITTKSERKSNIFLLSDSAILCQV